MKWLGYRMGKPQWIPENSGRSLSLTIQYPMGMGDWKKRMPLNNKNG